MGAEVGDKVKGALVGNEVTGADEGGEVTGSLLGDEVMGVGGTGPGPGAGSPPMVVGKLVGCVLELLFVFVDFPSELLADLVPTFAEATERVAKIMMAAEENFMVFDDLGCCNQSMRWLVLVFMNLLFFSF